VSITGGIDFASGVSFCDGADTINSSTTHPPMMIITRWKNLRVFVRTLVYDGQFPAESESFLTFLSGRD
jgi:hypothetical protein